MRYFCWNIVKIAKHKGFTPRTPCLRWLGALPPDPCKPPVVGAPPPDSPLLWWIPGYVPGGVIKRFKRLWEIRNRTFSLMRFGKKNRSKDDCQRVVYFIFPSLRSFAMNCEVYHDPSEIALLHLLLALIRGLDTHLFVKVPRPGDSKVTFSVFESSCNLLLSV